jgi:hypothetical protein
VTLVNKVRDFDPYSLKSGGVAAYFSFAYVLLLFFTGQHVQYYVLYFVFLCLASGLVAMAIGVKQYRQNEGRYPAIQGFLLGLGFCCAYLVLFIVDRGNLDIVIRFLCGEALLLQSSEWAKLSAIFLAIAISRCAFLGFRERLTWHLSPFLQIADKSAEARCD